MPHLRIRGMDSSLLEKNASALVAPLARIIDCPEDWITIEEMATRYLTQPPVVMIEVLWFSRGQEVQDAAAGLLTREVQAWAGVSPTVVFYPLEKANYYEDGAHF